MRSSIAFWLALIVSITAGIAFHWLAFIICCVMFCLGVLTVGFAYYEKTGQWLFDDLTDK